MKISVSTNMYSGGICFYWGEYSIWNSLPRNGKLMSTRSNRGEKTFLSLTLESVDVPSAIQQKTLSNWWLSFIHMWPKFSGFLASNFPIPLSVQIPLCTQYVQLLESICPCRYTLSLHELSWRKASLNYSFIRPNRECPPTTVELWNISVAQFA